MALSVDSSVGRIAGTPADNADLSPTSSFTAPAGSTLILCVSMDTDDVSSATSLSVSDSVDGTTGWVEKRHIDDTDSGSMGGGTSIWRKDISSSVSRTVTVRRTTGNGGTNRLSAKLYIVTNQDATDGTSGEGTSATNNATVALFTSTGANSYSFVAATDYNQRGTPVSSDLTEEGADYAGAISVMSGYKDNGSTGSETANLDAGGTSAAAWTWCAYEVLAASVGAAAMKTWVF